MRHIPLNQPLSMNRRAPPSTTSRPCFARPRRLLGNADGAQSDDVQALRERLREVLAEGQQSTLKNLSLRRFAARRGAPMR